MGVRGLPTEFATVCSQSVTPETRGKSGKNPPPAALWGNASLPSSLASFAIPIQNSV